MKNDGFYYTHELTTEALDFVVHAFHLFHNSEPKNSITPPTTDSTYWKFDDRGNIEWLLSSPKSTTGRWILYHWGEKVMSFNPELLETLLRRFNRAREQK